MILIILKTEGPIHQTLNQSIFIFFLQQNMRVKTSRDWSGINICEKKKLLISKTAEFHLRGINKLPDKWWDLVWNAGE